MQLRTRKKPQILKGPGATGVVWWVVKIGENLGSCNKTGIPGKPRIFMRDTHANKHTHPHDEHF